ncbi:hypothetical protein V8C44DRAFT_328733 [Trichoderma aethiopicum]
MFIGVAEGWKLLVQMQLVILSLQHPVSPTTNTCMVASCECSATMVTSLLSSVSCHGRWALNMNTGMDTPYQDQTLTPYLFPLLYFHQRNACSS